MKVVERISYTCRDRYIRVHILRNNEYMVETMSRNEKARVYMDKYCAASSWNKQR